MENLRNRARQQSGQTLGGPPPGGPEAWNRQRYGGGGDGGGRGPFSNLGGNIEEAIKRIRERQQQNQQMAQSGQMPQQQTGMAGLGQMLSMLRDRQSGVPPAQDQMMRPAVEPGGQSIPEGFAPPEGEAGGFTAWGQPAGTVPQGQGAPQGRQQMPQTGMAGLGQAAGKGLQMLQARALREGPKR